MPLENLTPANSQEYRLSRGGGATNKVVEVIVQSYVEQNYKLFILVSALTVTSISVVVGNRFVYFQLDIQLQRKIWYCYAN